MTHQPASRPWSFLFIGVVFEVIWVYLLKLSDGFRELVPSLLLLAVLPLSFYCFAKALKGLSIGTAYAAFTGLGTVGAVITGVLFMKEPLPWTTVLFVALLIGGIVGLKATESEPGTEQEKGA